MTNDEAQTIFAHALTLLTEAETPSNEDMLIKHNFAIVSLQIIKAYSASGNTIPGLGGLGLQEGIALAEQIIQTNGNVSKFRYDFKAIAKTLTI